MTVRAPFFTVSRFPLCKFPIPSFTLKNSPSISALTLKLEAVLKDAGIPAKRFAA